MEKVIQTSSKQDKPLIKDITPDSKHIEEELTQNTNSNKNLKPQIKRRPHPASHQGSIKQYETELQLMTLKVPQNESESLEIYRPTEPKKEQDFNEENKESKDFNLHYSTFTSQEKEVHQLMSQGNNQESRNKGRRKRRGLFI